MVPVLRNGDKTFAGVDFTPFINEDQEVGKFTAKDLVKKIAMKNKKELMALMNEDSELSEEEPKMEEESGKWEALKKCITIKIEI